MSAALVNRARRLAGMSGHEIYTRCRQAADKRFDILRHRLGGDAFHGSTSGLADRGAFFLASEETPRTIQILRRRFSAYEEQIVAQAQSILHRRFDLLGYTGLDFGRDVDWFLDPVNGKSAPAAPWPAIPFLDFEAVGDHKVIWELNRHQWMVTLAKAYRLTGEEQYAADLKALFQDWHCGNPYPLGVNWASTLEVAFRAYAWMWAAFLLEGTPAGSPEFQDLVTRQIERSGWYINRYLSTYFAPNTHLLGEGAVLFLIGTRYPGLRHSAEWQRTGWGIVTQSAARQVRADGFYFEQSTYYHVYALDLFLHARVLAERARVIIPQDLESVIRRMAAVLAQLSQAGALPRFGDDDGGRLFDPRRNLSPGMSDPLATAAVLYRDARLKASAGELREETLWLLGPGSAEVFDSIPSAAAPPGSVALPASGIYAMVSPGPPAAQLFIDAGEQGALSAGHGHADALSVQLACDGRLWLTDPGTCVYVGAQRERFRGTPAHNTVTVDGLHQADPKGPFSWGALPQVEVTRWIAGDGFDLFEGRHSGYGRLPEPVIHRRWVFRLNSEFWLVRDVLEGSGAHDLESFWHFAAGANVAENEGRIVASEGSETLSLLPLLSESWKYVVEPGAYSPVYGECVPAPVVRGYARVACPAETAVILTMGGVSPDAVFQQNGTAYEFLTGQTGHLFCFKREEPFWTYREWTSDAAFLYCGTSEAGKRHVIAAGGTYVDCAGKRVLTGSAPFLEYRDV